MFVAVFIICLMNPNSTSVCTASIGRDAPFYTKKECELSTQTTFASDSFKCIKVGQTLSASNSKSK